MRRQGPGKTRLRADVFPINPEKDKFPHRGVGNKKETSAKEHAVILERTRVLKKETSTATLPPIYKGYKDPASPWKKTMVCHTQPSANLHHIYLHTAHTHTHTHYQ